MKEVNHRNFTATHDEVYESNFSLAPFEQKISYLQRDKKYLRIHTPTPNKIYDLKNVFYITIPFVKNKILFVHITDGTPIPRMDEDMKSLMQIKIGFQEIEKLPFQTINVSSQEKITVFIFNDDSIIHYPSAYFIALKKIMSKKLNEGKNNIKESFEDFFQNEFKGENIVIEPKEGEEGVIIGIP